MLARLLATPANVLLLDEPTNQFSLDVVEQIEAALDNFPGAVVAVSHDRRFIEQFRGERWMLAGGGAIPLRRNLCVLHNQPPSLFVENG